MPTLISIKFTAVVVVVVVLSNVCVAPFTIATSITTATAATAAAAIAAEVVDVVVVMAVLAIPKSVCMAIKVPVPGE